LRVGRIDLGPPGWIGAAFSAKPQRESPDPVADHDGEQRQNRTVFGSREALEKLSHHATDYPEQTRFKETAVGKSTNKERLDKLLVARELVETRTRAQALIMAGKVRVGEAKVDKPGTAVPLDAEITVVGQLHPYVSRGGVKLAGALDTFDALDVSGRVAMDVGASTGGFTDCLLQRGVSKVFAVDVGYGQLAWKLVSDDRVVVLDRQNIRKLQPEQIGEPVSLVVADCSFIALAKVLPHLPPFLSPGADAVVLVKPQFELEPERVGKGGIVRDEQARLDAIASVKAAASACGFTCHGEVASPISGRDGNVEFLLWLRWTPS
jgi:23S rRNA (cytidine1920-2'-O)/16S rRNA (cytidine1409-2'-O)-methyltransferase